MLALAAGCSGGTKAGGKHQQHTVVLTIANHEGADRDLAEYIAAVNRLSDGSMRLVVRDGWRGSDVDYDRGTVADVRAGKVDLAKISARSYDLLGVDDLQAMMAPLLVDGLALEEKVLASRLPDEMLRGIQRLGVEGLAMLPGPLRRPFGLERRLLGPADYRDAAIGVRPALVSALTFETLGATPRAYLPGELPPWRYDGAELDLYTLEGNHYAVHGRSSVTANVAYWPRALTIVGNPKVVAKLTSGQRAILREAGREALVPAIERLRVEDRDEAAILCRRDQVAFVKATPPQLAALRAAVRPVYTKLERRPETRSLIDKIQAMKQQSAPGGTLQCIRSLPREQAASPLDGVWEMTATRAVAGDIDAGRYRLVLRRGRISMSHLGPGSWHNNGVFSVDGENVHFRFTDGDGLYRWNVYRDTLTLRFVPGHVSGAPNPTFAPWHRVGR